MNQHYILCEIRKECVTCMMLSETSGAKAMKLSTVFQ